MSESYERGIGHGWDAANYGDAYGVTESVTDEAERRSRGDAEYAAGFLEGWDRYQLEQWKDGTPRDEE